MACYCWAEYFAPFGHEWSIATRKEEVPPEELKRRGEEFFKQMGGKPS